ncbi:hydroxysteroid dehydrogenase [Murmansk poxvirus]|uniref:3 beta-hydroxysteroid dehydrogenase/Delta 5-->4-isomerase n=1 Tax=Murmansk poxvirus TaxID=2025359 RepID=A0A223FN07_9POXV|nr:nucleotide-sugar epimerase [Murmansk poxvirus]AST09357.1 hydroxysteroid dehydrogenase [Murmansk poxvirus]
MSVYAVTGGVGFLGKYIVKLLIDRCSYVNEIRVVDAEIDPEPYNPDTKRVKYIHCDINDYDTMYKELKGVDVIIHTAALVDVFGKYKDDDIVKVNYRGTETVLAVCINLGIRYLIYTSSMEVVGPNTHGDAFFGDEHTRYNISHGHIYAKSKYDTEYLVRSANGCIVITGDLLYTCCLRPTGIYGEGDKLMKEIYTQCVRKGKIMYRTIDDDAVHSRVYVGNVAWMHILAAKHIQYPDSVVRGNYYFCYDNSPVCSYDKFNLLVMEPLGIKSGPRISRTILKTIALKNDLFIKLFRVPALLNSYTLKISNTRFEVRTNKANIDFNYEPIFSTSEAIIRTTKWLQSFS